MANIDAPRGFKPISTIDGRDCVAHEYVLTTGSTVYKGDPVRIVTAGTVQASAAASGVINLGIAAEYVSDSLSAGGKKIMVYDSPNNLYEVQVTTGQTLTIADNFGTADIITYAAGNTNTGQSIMELDNPAGSTAPWLIMRLSPVIGNAWGEHCKVIAKPNICVWNAGYAGLT
jgi:hypothetical protein